MSGLRCRWRLRRCSVVAVAVGPPRSRSPWGKAVKVRDLEAGWLSELMARVEVGEISEFVFLQVL